ncbi:MAG: DUF748 domain-containing protein [Verrucomicrobiota bacterium]
MNAGRSDSKNPSTRRARRLKWLAGLLLFYTVFGFLILPAIVRSVAVKQLSAQLDREVSIRQVRINPYALSTSIRGLLIKDKDGQPFISWDEVYVNFQLSSLVGHPWVFREIMTSNTFVRVQMNPDRTLNFSDLIAKFSTNTAPSPKPSAPPGLRIDKLRIIGASAAVADLTTRTPFRHVAGPMHLTMENFHTDRSSKNPHAFTGTTATGEKISWAGHFYLDPLRSQGEFAIENLALTNFAALYQDLLRFQIRDGVVGFRTQYQFDFDATNRLARATNGAFTLRSFKVAAPGADHPFVEMPEFSVTGIAGDLGARYGEIGLIAGRGGRLELVRDASAAINVVELAKPADTATNLPGGIQFILGSVTNVVAQLLDSTNAWTGLIREVNFQDSALNLTDLVNARPVTLSLDQIAFTATNISNLSGRDLASSLFVRWQTNGTVRADATFSFSPLTADVRLALDALALRPLDPYLESRLNLFILDSKFGLDGRLRVRTAPDALPEITFTGDTWVDDLATVDGALGEDLLKWSSLRVSGIDASLNPPRVAIREVAARDAYARVVIETNRTINLLAALRLNETNAPAAEAKASAPKSATTNSLPDLSIASVVVSNAQLRFTDRSIHPAVNLSIQQATGSVNGLSTRELQHADVNLKARVDGIGPAEITGTINPFSATSTNDIKITANNIDLTPTSPYAGKFAGYRIAKGKLNLALGYHLQGRNLRAENLIVLDQFTFGEKVASPDATKLPVRLGIAILKDRNGKIELDVPIEGSLDDPQLKLSKVIWRAIENILVKVATSPFSLLGAAFGGKGEEMNFQDFAPGSFALQPEGTNKLEVLVKGLYERPGLQLEITGSVDPEADRDGLRRVALDKQLRAEKWQSLRKSERTTTAPDQVSLTAEEREKWVRRLFDNLPVTASTTPTNVIATNASPAMAVTAPPANRRAAVPLKGATAQMNLKPAVPVLVQTSTNGQTVVVSPQTPEQVLLGRIEITESDLETLAAERARAVRDYLQQGGRVEPERIFITEKQPGNLKASGSKAFLQLQ